MNNEVGGCGRETGGGEVVMDSRGHSLLVARHMVGRHKVIKRCLEVGGELQLCRFLHTKPPWLHPCWLVFMIMSL